MGNATQFEREQRAHLDRAKSALDAFLALPADASYAEVVDAFDRIRFPLDEMHGPIALFSQVHPDQAMRDVSKTLVQELSAFETDLSLNRDVFERLVALEGAEAPGPVEQRLVEHALRDYRRSGVDRDEDTRNRIKELSEELVKVGQNFDLNIAGDMRSIRIPEGAAGLAGLPADYVAKHAPDADGSVTITTDAPDIVPFLSYAERGDLRRELYREYNSRAVPENLQLLRDMIARRHELAQLLGYASYADYVTEDKMIKSAAAAREFIAKIADRARPRMRAEYEELLDKKRESEPSADQVHDWERSYWIERVKADRLGFDSQSVRPYFKYENVRDGVLATSAALYSVEFKRNPGIPVWHPSVECYDVFDSAERVARFYLDMHPRPDKYKHAAMFHVKTGVEGRRLPEACLVCNFAAPTADDPALMGHRQVTTFFHEFGHLLHHLFGGRQRYLSFSGIATEWDFVEVPSQMYEEWAWDAGVLQRFALHHETGEPIGAELVRRLRDAEEYGKGIQVGQQMFYAALSLAYYDAEPETIDLDRTMIELKRDMTPFPHEEGTHFQASFGHLHGYSAIYYTYMWSLVIAKDLFSQFEEHLMDGATARRYRQAVLAPGGSKDAAELVRDFLGRDYAFAAWERWLNR
jgi:thimet oligopeptidase